MYRIAEVNIWNKLTSWQAIIIYVIIVIVAMILIAVSVIINERRFSKVTENLKKTDDELSKQEDDVKPAVEGRFGSLNNIDSNAANLKKLTFDEVSGLKELCEEFRYYAAGKLGLYYDISDIREFIAGMGVSHIIILQGISGTGKTSLAYAIGEFLGNPSTIIPVQPMWKERTDLLGYYNEFTKRYNETPLLEKIYEASYRNDITIAILDEMNIARVEYYFAEFLSLLEIPNAEARNLEIVSDSWQNDPKNLVNGKIRLSENIWFIGTINNDDSTFAISDKVYDRAMVMNFDRRAEPFKASGGRQIHVSYKRFNELMEKAAENYVMPSEIGQKLQELDEYMIDKFKITFGNRIMKQMLRFIPVFVSCGGEEYDALDDFICKKVMRKLELQNSAYVKNEADGLIAKLDSLFGENKMNKCKQYVRRIAAAV